MTAFLDRTLAGFRRTGMSLSAAFVAGLADELTRATPFAELLLAHPAATTPTFGARVLAGIHHLVLTGRAPQLAEYIACGAGDAHDVAWPLARRAALDHPGELLTALDRQVQQHHPARANALLTGLGLLRTRRIRLLELGSCAGLALVPDRYRWDGPGWTWGDPESPVRLTTTGPSPGRIEFVERRGCDIAPLDPADPETSVVLRSFLPVEAATTQRDVDNALRLAALDPPAVDAAPAGAWLRDQLRSASPDVLTVVWHSMVWHLLSRDERDAVQDALVEAGGRGPVAEVAFEPLEPGGPMTLQVISYLA